MGICGNFLLVIGVTKGESKDWKHLAEIIDGWPLKKRKSYKEVVDMMTFVEVHSEAGENW